MEEGTLIVNWPELSVVVTLEVPSTVTVTPDSACPFKSVTFPVTFLDCEKAIETKKNRKRENAKNLFKNGCNPEYAFLIGSIFALVEQILISSNFGVYAEILMVK